MHIIVLWVIFYVIHFIKLHQLRNWNEYFNRSIIEIENNQDRDYTYNTFQARNGVAPHILPTWSLSAVYGGDGLILRVQHSATLLYTARLYCFYLQVIFKGLAAYEG